MSLSERVRRSEGSRLVCVECFIASIDGIGESRKRRDIVACEFCLGFVLLTPFFELGQVGSVDLGGIVKSTEGNTDGLTLCFAALGTGSSVLTSRHFCFLHCCCSEPSDLAWPA